MLRSTYRRTLDPVRTLLNETVFRNRGVIRQVFRWSPFDLYNYMYDPHQLLQICRCIDSVKNVEGSFVEIGCAYGRTTAFLCKYIRSLGITSEYLAMDTFAGFTDAAIAHEVTTRGKPGKAIANSFRLNRKAWVEAGLRDLELENVRLEQGDCTNFDFDKIKPIAFVLVDVDLYLPISIILPRIYESMSAGGVIVVDDCQLEDGRWDGAYQAFNEFTQQRGLPGEIVADKLGIIVKQGHPRSS